MLVNIGTHLLSQRYMHHLIIPSLISGTSMFNDYITANISISRQKARLISLETAGQEIRRIRAPPNGKKRELIFTFNFHMICVWQEFSFLQQLSGYLGMACTYEV